MSKKHKGTAATQKERNLKAMERLTALLRDAGDDESDAWADSLDSFFDELASNDAFGTEGQCDPRGDFRNGEWSMRRVEGLDK